MAETIIKGNNQQNTKGSLDNLGQGSFAGGNFPLLIPKKNEETSAPTANPSNDKDSVILSTQVTAPQFDFAATPFAVRLNGNEANTLNFVLKKEDDAVYQTELKIDGALAKKILAMKAEDPKVAAQLYREALSSLDPAITDLRDPKKMSLALITRDEHWRETKLAQALKLKSEIFEAQGKKGEAKEAHEESFKLEQGVQVGVRKEFDEQLALLKGGPRKSFEETQQILGDLSALLPYLENFRKTEATLDEKIQDGRRLHQYYKSLVSIPRYDKPEMRKKLSEAEKDLAELRDQLRGTLSPSPSTGEGQGEGDPKVQLRNAKRVVELDYELGDDKKKTHITTLGSQSLTFTDRESPKNLVEDLERWALLLDGKSNGVIDDKQRVDQQCEILKYWVKIREEVKNGRESPFELTEEQILQKMKGLRDQIVHTAWARVTHSREEEYQLGGMLDRVIHQNETQLLKFVSQRGIESYLREGSETDKAFEKAKGISDPKERREALVALLKDYEDLQDSSKSRSVVEAIQKTFSAETPSEERLETYLELHQRLKKNGFPVASEVKQTLDQLAYTSWQDLKKTASRDASTVRTLLLLKQYAQAEGQHEGAKAVKEKIEKIRNSLVEDREAGKIQELPFEASLLVVQIDQALLNDDLGEAKEDKEKRKEIQDRCLFNLNGALNDLEKSKDPAEKRMDQALNLLEIAKGYQSLTKGEKDPFNANRGLGKEQTFSAKAIGRSLEINIQSLQMKIGSLASEVATEKLAAIFEKFPPRDTSPEEQKVLLSQITDDLQKLIQKKMAGDPPDLAWLAHVDSTIFLKDFFEQWVIADGHLKKVGADPEKRTPQDLENCEDAAEIFAHLGLTDRVNQALVPMITLAHEERLELESRGKLLWMISESYRSAGMTNEANGALDELSQLADEKAPKSLKDLAEIVAAKKCLNNGNFDQAELELVKLPHNEMAKLFLENIREGRTALRTAQTVEILQAWFENYVEDLKEDEGEERATALKQEGEALFTQVERQMQSENVDVETALRRTMKMGCSKTFADGKINEDLLDAIRHLQGMRIPYSGKTYLQELSRPHLSDEGFASWSLNLARTLAHKEEFYGAAQQIAQMFADTYGFRKEVHEFLNDTLPDLQFRNGITHMIPIVNIFAAKNEKKRTQALIHSVAEVGLFAVGEGFMVAADFAFALRAAKKIQTVLRIRTEARLLKMGMEAKRAEKIGEFVAHYGAKGFRGFIKNGANAFGFTLAQNKFRLETILTKEFWRSWASMGTTFAVAGVFGSRGPSSWFSQRVRGTAGFLAAGYVNQYVTGLEDKTNDPFFTRLVHAGIGDFNSWLSGSILRKASFGVAHHMQERAEKIHFENQFAPLGQRLGFDFRRDWKGNLSDGSRMFVDRVMQRMETLDHVKGRGDRLLALEGSLKSISKEALDRSVKALDAEGAQGDVMRAAAFSRMESRAQEAKKEVKVTEAKASEAAAEPHGTLTTEPVEAELTQIKTGFDQFLSRFGGKIPSELKALLLAEALFKGLSAKEIASLEAQGQEIHQSLEAMAKNLGGKLPLSLLRIAIRNAKDVGEISKYLNKLAEELPGLKTKLEKELGKKFAMQETELHQEMEKILAQALESSLEASEPQMISMKIRALVDQLVDRRKKELRTKIAIQKVYAKAKQELGRVKKLKSAAEDAAKSFVLKNPLTWAALGAGGMGGGHSPKASKPDMKPFEAQRLSLIKECQQRYSAWNRLVDTIAETFKFRHTFADPTEMKKQSVQQNRYEAATDLMELANSLPEPTREQSMQVVWDTFTELAVEGYSPLEVLQGVRRLADYHANDPKSLQHEINFLTEMEAHTEDPEIKTEVAKTRREIIAMIPSGYRGHNQGSNKGEGSAHSIALLAGAGELFNLSDTNLEPGTIAAGVVGAAVVVGFTLKHVIGNFLPGLRQRVGKWAKDLALKNPLTWMFLGAGGIGSMGGEKKGFSKALATLKWNFREIMSEELDKVTIAKLVGLVDPSLKTELLRKLCEGGETADQLLAAEVLIESKKDLNKEKQLIETVFRTLVKLCRNKDSHVQMRAAEVLRKLSGHLEEEAKRQALKTSLEILQILCRDNDREIRGAVLYYLKGLGENLKGDKVLLETALKTLMKFCQIRDPKFQNGAAEALGKLSRHLGGKAKKQALETALETLQGLCGYEDSWVRLDAVFALKDLIESLKGYKVLLYTAFNTLLTLTEDVSPYIRCNAAETLGKLSRNLDGVAKNMALEIAFKIVHEVGLDENTDVKTAQETLWKLSEHLDGEAKTRLLEEELKKLEGLSWERSPDILRGIAYGLAELSGYLAEERLLLEKTLKILIRLCGDENFHDHWYGAMAFEKFSEHLKRGNPLMVTALKPHLKTGVETLMALSGNKDPSVRGKVATALESLSGHLEGEALETAFKTLKDLCSDVHTAQALGKLSENLEGEAKKQALEMALETLLKLCGDKDPSVRQQAVYALIKLAEAHPETQAFFTRRITNFDVRHVPGTSASHEKISESTGEERKEELPLSEVSPNKTGPQVETAAPKPTVETNKDKDPLHSFALLAGAGGFFNFNDPNVEPATIAAGVIGAAVVVGLAFKNVIGQFLPGFRQKLRKLARNIALKNPLTWMFLGAGGVGGGSSISSLSEKRIQNTIRTNEEIFSGKIKLEGKTFWEVYQEAWKTKEVKPHHIAYGKEEPPTQVYLELDAHHQIKRLLTDNEYRFTERKTLDYERRRYVVLQFNDETFTLWRWSYTERDQVHHSKAPRDGNAESKKILDELLGNSILPSHLSAEEAQAQLLKSLGAHRVKVESLNSLTPTPRLEVARAEAKPVTHEISTTDGKVTHLPSEIGGRLIFTNGQYEPVRGEVVVVNDQFERASAEIRCLEDGYHLFEIEGEFTVNGKKISMFHHLQEGDIVKIGAVEFTFNKKTPNAFSEGTPKLKPITGGKTEKSHLSIMALAGLGSFSDGVEMLLENPLVQGAFMIMGVAFGVWGLKRLHSHWKETQPQRKLKAAKKSSAESLEDPSMTWVAPLIPKEGRNFLSASEIPLEYMKLNGTDEKGRITVACLAKDCTIEGIRFYKNNWVEFDENGKLTKRVKEKGAGFFTPFKTLTASGIGLATLFHSDIAEAATQVGHSAGGISAIELSLGILVLGSVLIRTNSGVRHLLDKLASPQKEKEISEEQSQGIDKILVTPEESSRTLPSALSTGAVKFDLSALHPQKQKMVTEWLEDRSLDSLTTTEQRALISHLAGNKKWKRGEIQSLIGLTGMRDLLGYGKELPFGFDSIEQWKGFQKKLMEGLVAAGVPLDDPRVKLVLQGSAVIGKSHESKNGTPFRWLGDHRSPNKDYRRPSDLDIALLVDNDLFDTFLARRSQSVIEKEGAADGPRATRDLKRIQKEGRLAPNDLDADLQKHLLNMRVLHGQRPLQISIMRPGCYLIPNSTETMAISADVLTGPAHPSVAKDKLLKMGNSPGPLVALVAAGAGLATLLGSDVAHAAVQGGANSGSFIGILQTGLAVLALGGVFSWGTRKIKGIFSRENAENKPKVGENEIVPLGIPYRDHFPIQHQKVERMQKASLAVSSLLKTLDSENLLWARERERQGVEKTLSQWTAHGNWETVEHLNSRPGIRLILDHVAREVGIPKSILLTHLLETSQSPQDLEKQLDQFQNLLLHQGVKVQITALSILNSLIETAQTEERMAIRLDPPSKENFAKHLSGQIFQLILKKGFSEDEVTPFLEELTHQWRKLSFEKNSETGIPQLGFQKVESSHYLRPQWFRLLSAVLTHGYSPFFSEYPPFFEFLRQIPDRYLQEDRIQYLGELREGFTEDKNKIASYIYLIRRFKGEVQATNPFENIMDKKFKVADPRLKIQLEREMEQGAQALRGVLGGPKSNTVLEHYLFLLQKLSMGNREIERGAAALRSFVRKSQEADLRNQIGGYFSVVFRLPVGHPEYSEAAKILREFYRDKKISSAQTRAYWNSLAPRLSEKQYEETLNELADQTFVWGSNSPFFEEIYRAHEKAIRVRVATGPSEAARPRVILPLQELEPFEIEEPEEEKSGIRKKAWILPH